MRAYLRTLGVWTLLVGMSVASRASAQEAPTPPAVTRFFDEVPESHVAARLLGPSDVRTEPSDAGHLVAQLPLGAVVTRLASRGDAVLVEIGDPKDPYKPLLGWVPREALERRPASPAPATAPLMTDGKALVHIGGPRELALEERIDGRWRAVCHAPCDVRLPLAAQYRINGDGIAVSKPFALAAIDGRAVLHVVPGSTGDRTAGLFFIIVGAPAVPIGVALALLMGMGQGDGAAVYVAEGAAATGALFVILGAAFLAGRDQTEVTQPNARTTAPVPAWSSSLVERTPSPGASFVVPLLSGTF